MAAASFEGLQFVASNLTNGYDVAVTFKARRDTRRTGRIVFCSSGAFRRGTPGYVAYSSAKAGIVGLTRALARAFAPHTPASSTRRCLAAR